MGSHRGCDLEEVYAMRVSIVFGPDSKIYEGSECLAVETFDADIIRVNSAVRPIMLAPYHEFTKRDLGPQNIELHVQGIDLTQSWLTGWYKSCLVIDMGKCIPDWSESRRNPHPQLANMLRTITGVEHGEIGIYD